MSADKKQRSVFGLVIGLVVILVISLVFVGGLSGWFDDPRVILEQKYYCGDECGEFNFMELSKEKYEALIEAKETFIVFIDQDDCHTADRVREFVKDFASDKKIKVYRMMFSDSKSTSLHDHVKYYPSVVIVANGKIKFFLRADSDDDAEAYNNYEDFRKWINQYI